VRARIHACRLLGALCILLTLACVRGAPVGAAPPRVLFGEEPVSSEQGPAHPATVGTALRLREGPYPDAKVVLLLRLGDAVQVVAGPVEEGDALWVYVVTERAGQRYEGFCASRYLIGQPDAIRPRATATPLPALPPPTTGEAYQVRVSAYGGLRLRAGPGLEHPVEGIAAHRAVLTATGRSQQAGGYTWVEVVFEGRRLWGASQYLIRVEP